MSPSRSLRAVVYGRFPPVPTGALPVDGLILDAKSPLCAIPAAELSSQYCSHRSASRISAAVRNRRMDASPRDSSPPESSAPCANADKLPDKSPVPIVAAPAATIPFCRNLRRLDEFLRILPDFFMTSSLFLKSSVVVFVLHCHLESSVQSVQIPALGPGLRQAPVFPKPDPWRCAVLQQ